jgi:hypothetical protein
VYGALAYANDWKDVLPSFSPGDVRYWNDWNRPFPDTVINRRNLHTWSRLPIIGFDTTTNVNPVHRQQGGLAFVMRDYLKSDWDMAFCPESWFEKRGKGLVPDEPKVPTGTLYLGHRPPSEKDVGNPYIDGDIPTSASDPASWALFTDMTIMTGAENVKPLRMASNHVDERKHIKGSALPEEWPELLNSDPKVNHDVFPAGGNVAQLDARVSWFDRASLQPRYYFTFNSVPARYWWGSDSDAKSKSW